MPLGAYLLHIVMHLWTYVCAGVVAVLSGAKTRAPKDAEPLLPQSPALIENYYRVAAVALDLPSHPLGALTHACLWPLAIMLGMLFDQQLARIVLGYLYSSEACSRRIAALRKALESGTAQHDASAPPPPTDDDDDAAAQYRAFVRLRDQCWYLTPRAYVVSGTRLTRRCGARRDNGRDRRPAEGHRCTRPRAICVATRASAQ